MIKTMGVLFDKILLFLFWLAGGLLMFATVGTCIDVILRYSLNRPIHWMLEITEYIMLYIPFLCAAIVLKEEGHIRVDLLISRFSRKNKTWVNLITSLVGGIVMLIYAGFGAQATLDAFKRGVPSLESLKIPVFLILMIIPIGSFLFTIQFLRQTVRYYGELKN
jgi:TRAP-type C4-dicarboxylate transport system permease small subunit